MHKHTLTEQTSEKNITNINSVGYSAFNCVYVTMYFENNKSYNIECNLNETESQNVSFLLLTCCVTFNKLLKRVKT